MNNTIKISKAVLMQSGILMLVLFMSACVTEFIPDLKEEQDLLVIEGLLTDQADQHLIRLSRSTPLGKRSESKPVKGCFVTVTDDQGQRVLFTEGDSGKYLSPAGFRGIPGRTYVLHVKTGSEYNNINYESLPVKMLPVPPIARVWYNKTVIKEPVDGFFGIDGCNILLDTYDPGLTCRYYRWDFKETWIHRLLFPVENMKCWVSAVSHDINISSTAAYTDSKILNHKLTYISNESDRLKRKYSIEVNQYSLQQDEYNYLGKLRTLSSGGGGLYDRIPASVPNNLFCVEDAAEKVLGYFSVSSKTSFRIFIEDNFDVIVNRYENCIDTVVYGDQDPKNLNAGLWVLIDHPPSSGSPRTRWLTRTQGCADCTVRGTTVKPSFWIGD